MEQHGFIHDMLDVKVLILYIMSRVQYPVDVDKVYELAYQDDCVSYFDVAQALPEMVDTGHLSRSEKGEYAITPKGIETGKVTDDSLAYPVMQRVQAAVERFNRECRRDNFIHIRTVEKGQDEYAVIMGLDDEIGNLMTLELSAPGRTQAKKLSKAFQDRAEIIYRMIMTELLDEPEHDDDTI